MLRYIPRKKEVIDRRSTEGGYYEAQCEECGNTFYPKRSSAKYCSRSCTVMAYRRAIKNKIAEPRASKMPKMAKINECNGAKNVPHVLKELNCNVTGKMGTIRHEASDMDINQKMTFDHITVVRLSERKFGFYENV